jgi:hypothetical protein
MFLSYLSFKKKRKKLNVRENRRDNQNGKSRETGNIGYARHMTKINTTKTKNNMC